MKEFIRVGADLAKNYFQIYALASEDRGAATRKLSRQAMRKFLSETKPCVTGMEACGSAHYWARELQAMGHAARLIPLRIRHDRRQGDRTRRRTDRKSRERCDA